MQPLPHIEKIIVSIFRIYCYFFPFNPVLRINIWTTTSKIYLMTFVIRQLNWNKNKITSFYVSKFPWYLEQSDSKSSSTTSFVSLLRCKFYFILLLECIIRSSSASFEEIKLIVIVNWIFHLQEFWRSIIIFHK